MKTRDEMVEALIDDLCDTITQWVLQDTDSLRAWVASQMQYERLSDEEVAEQWRGSLGDKPGNESDAEGMQTPLPPDVAPAPRVTFTIWRRCRCSPMEHREECLCSLPRSSVTCQREVRVVISNLDACPDRLDTFGVLTMHFSVVATWEDDGSPAGTLSRSELDEVHDKIISEHWA